MTNCSDQQLLSYYKIVYAIVWLDLWMIFIGVGALYYFSAMQVRNATLDPISEKSGWFLIRIFVFRGAELFGKVSWRIQTPQKLDTRQILKKLLLICLT
jgi:hypothetical protein